MSASTPRRAAARAVARAERPGAGQRHRARPSAIPPQHIREDFGTTRFDDNLSSKDLLFAVYTVDDSTANTPSQNPLSLINESLREQVASVQEQHVFSPSLLNTARFGYSRASFFFTGYTSGRRFPAGSPASPSAPSSSAAARPRTAHRRSRRPGTNVGSNNTATRNLFTCDDHVYWSHGRHQIEAGVWLQRIPVQRSAGAGPVRPGLIQHASRRSCRAR